MASVYEIVTEKILAELEKGNIPWRKPWHGGEAPANAVTGKAYRGVNPFLLSCSPYSDHRWLTYKQAAEKGGNVKKGEKGSLVVFWKMTKKEEEGEEKRIPILRYYTIFNLEQCEGLTFPALTPIGNAIPPQEAADSIIAAYAGPQVRHEGDRACYSPALDVVLMPARNQFDAQEGYYGTLFHELTHSTGHVSRLNRFDGPARYFGDTEYSKEELIAEFGSAFLCAHAGMEKGIPNSAAYIAGWSRTLKGDPRMVVHAAANAQRAADCILGIKHGEEAGE